MNYYHRDFLNDVGAEWAKYIPQSPKVLAKIAGVGKGNKNHTDAYAR